MRASLLPALFPCLWLVLSPLPAARLPADSVSAAIRSDALGQRSLLITIQEGAVSGLDEIRLKIESNAAANAKGRLLPEGWQLLKRGSELRLSGPPLAEFPTRIRLDIGGRSPPRRIKLFLGAGRRKIFEGRIPLQTLPSVEVEDNLEDLLLFPDVVSPGEQIELGILDPLRTPPGGRWKIAGAEAEAAADGRRLTWTVPEALEEGVQPQVTFHDAWGELLVDASPSPGIHLRQIHVDEETVPRLTGCVSHVPVGGIAQVCGRFPPEARSGLTIDGRPTGEPLAFSQHVVLLRIPPELPPGVHVIAGDPRLGFPPSDQVLITVFRVHASIDKEQLTQNESTQVRFAVEGTSEVFELELTNHNPELVSLEGGSSQIAATTGGTPNTVVRQLRKVAFVPGQARDFRLTYKIPARASPCANDQGIPHHSDGYLTARVLASIPVAPGAAMNAVAQALAAGFGLNLLEVQALNSSNLGLITFQIPDARTVPAVAALLEADPRVIFAQPDYVYETNGQSSFNDPYAELSYGPTLIGANQVHQYATGRGITVGVVDTGIDLQHVELKARVAEHKDFTGMGYSADIHGTQVAGIIAAEPNNGVGIFGVAPGSRLLALKACQPHSAQAVRAQCWSSALAKAIDYSLLMNVQVLNLSVGGRREDRILTRQIGAAASRGRVVVAAAGNDGPRGDPSYPAALESVLAVTAVDVQRNLYPFATQGTFIDLAAPGVEVVSTAPKEQFPVCSGTSFATAFVTGAVALLLEGRPELTPLQVQELLEGSADDLGEIGKDRQFGSGLVDACETLQRALGGKITCN